MHLTASGLPALGCEMHQTPSALGFPNTAAWLDLNPYILVAVCILPSKYTELIPRVQRRVQVQVPTGSPLNQVLNTPNVSLTSIVSSPVNPRK